MQKLHIPTPQNEELENESKVEDARRLQEEEIKVIFLLPDISETIQMFKKGQTIAVLKSYLSTELDISMDTMKLYHDTIELFDPYTLTDYPDIESQDVVRIVVKNSRK